MPEEILMVSLFKELRAKMLAENNEAGSENCAR
jgi:hypothetical protein